MTVDQSAIQDTLATMRVFRTVVTSIKRTAPFPVGTSGKFEIIHIGPATIHKVKKIGSKYDAVISHACVVKLLPSGTATNVRLNPGIITAMGQGQIVTVVPQDATDPNNKYTDYECEKEVNDESVLKFFTSIATSAAKAAEKDAKKNQPAATT